MRRIARQAAPRANLGRLAATTPDVRARFSPYTNPCTHAAFLYATTLSRCPLLRTCDGDHRAPRRGCDRACARRRANLGRLVRGVLAALSGRPAHGYAVIDGPHQLGDCSDVVGDRAFHKRVPSDAGLHGDVHTSDNKNDGDTRPAGLPLQRNGSELRSD